MCVCVREDEVKWKNPLPNQERNDLFLFLLRFSKIKNASET